VNSPVKSYGLRFGLSRSIDWGPGATHYKSVLQLLEAQVERPPPRAILDDLSLALDTSAVHINSPVLEEQPKPLPPPYISRRSSPSSVASPTQQQQFSEESTAESPISPLPLSPLPRPHLARRKESGTSFEPR